MSSLVMGRVRWIVGTGIRIHVAVWIQHGAMLLMLLVGAWLGRVRRLRRPTSASIQTWPGGWPSNAARHRLPSRQMITIHHAGLG